MSLVRLVSFEWPLAIQRVTNAILLMHTVIISCISILLHCFYHAYVASSWALLHIGIFKYTIYISIDHRNNSLVNVMFQHCPSSYEANLTYKSPEISELNGVFFYLSELNRVKI